MQQSEFNENISEWVVVMNARMSLMQEQLDDIMLIIEEDSQTLRYQYMVIEHLMKK